MRIIKFHVKLVKLRPCPVPQHTHSVAGKSGFQVRPLIRSVKTYVFQISCYIVPSRCQHVRVSSMFPLCSSVDTGPGPGQYGTEWGVSSKGTGFGTSARVDWTNNHTPAGAEYSPTLSQTAGRKPVYSFGGKAKKGRLCVLYSHSRAKSMSACGGWGAHFHFASLPEH